MPKQPQVKQFGYVAGNQLLLEACVFARNIIIARFLGAESLGEFIFLILSIRLFAMSTDLAAERFIVKVRKPAVPGALAAIHLLNKVKASALAILLLIMGLNQVQGIGFTVYAALAASEFVRGFTHHGYFLKQRSLNFRPALYVQGLTAVFGTFVIYCAAALAPSLDVICLCIIGQMFVQVALSHILADQSYRSDATAKDLRAMVCFGWPLLFTGVTMFWSMQGERLILAALLPPADFAHFSMLFQLALVPVLVMSRMVLTIGLPQLAQVKPGTGFDRKLDQLHQWTYAGATVFSVAFILLSNFALTHLFGSDFRAEISLVVLVAAAQFLRLCRAPQSVAAQALGQTDIPLKSNLVRVFFVLIAIGAAIAGAPLAALLIIACVGEGAAWAAQGMLFSLRNRKRVSSPAPQLKPQEIM